MDARPECDIAAAEKGPSRKPDGRRGAGLLSAFHKIFSDRNTLNIQSIGHLECVGSCPDLTMSRRDAAAAPAAPLAALTPRLPPRALCHRPLCASVSSDSSGRFKALHTQEWKNNLKAQMEQAHSAGAASSTGSLERASLFCAPGGPPKASAARFSLFSPPRNVDSDPPSRSGSKKLRNYGRRAATGPAGAREPPGGEAGGGASPSPGLPRHFEPVISKVTDYIYVGNLNAAYNGRALCRNNIDSIIDVSGAPGRAAPAHSLIPCTCSRGARHSWSRLKVDIAHVKPRCFEDVNECIHASAGKRKRVLVHCGDGFSLAPTCVIQYLMLKRDMRLVAAYELLRARYPVNIRECHRNLLVSLERTLRPGDADPESFRQAISRKVAWT
ncbi:uncharacterized protein LOC127597940 isoform X2 [Hippocampus zosterae]|uniref:uncharacterized protein LOC127597940 isoform X2 n=1 Tax=Hippocampus zosterae TaxID=109293 RepID=UPI00223CD429|nr:uncharacterized protein LOC127597940 isoform X2 [Hippocampus zosterae]XP_051917285.1 uncharacterized protein LOC127597940 isoform X2 [Hippocampus zosterae]